MINIDVLLTGLDAALHDEAEDAPRTILREARALAHEEGKLSVLTMIGAKDVNWPNPYRETENGWTRETNERKTLMKDYGRDRINAGLFSSNEDSWATPQDLFDTLDAEFGFTLDPCASPSNAKCERYFTVEDDGLARPWDGVVFMNPPYGRGIGDWVRKAYEESQRGATVVCLIPARTDTGYWHDYVMRAAEVRFIRGRLHFGGDHERTAHNAPFPSAVVVFGPDRSPSMKGMNR